MTNNKSPRAIAEEILRGLDGIDTEPIKPRSNPDTSALYGGIAGAKIDFPEFELAPGLTVRPTYSHVMAPYILAFAPPHKPNVPHPGPWKAAKGGLGFDITIEIALAEFARPTSFSRINTVWWVLALLRLITKAPIRLPVIADQSFAMIAESST